MSAFFAYIIERLSFFPATLPGAAAEGLIWGLMAIGVYISYKILDIADLTVDGSICTGGCVCAVMLAAGMPVWASVLAAFIAGALAGTLTGLLHTALGIPSILAGILTQLMLYSVNLLTLSGLSLLGLSSQPPTPEWGFMLSEGRKFITSAPWLIIWPGSVIVLHVVIFNLLGDSLRDILDPRYEKQKGKWRKLKQWQANA